MNNKSKLFIVGGGWAGLSCAIRLKHQGHAIKLFEASRQLGGRARCTQYKGVKLDNGQHILVGSCQETLELFQLLGMNEADYLYRQNLTLVLHDVISSKKTLTIKPANLAAPLHLLIGFINAEGLSIKEKYLLIRFFMLLKIKNYQLKHDCALLQLLLQYQQSKSIISKFWQPLCLAIMNTPIAIASAQIFINILKASFSTDKKNSDLLIFKQPLCEVLPKNAFEYLQTDKSTIQMSSKVSDIEVENNTLKAIKVDNKTIPCDTLILATPLHITAKLLAPHSSCKVLVNQLDHIDYQPIYTIYLKYHQAIQLNKKMVGLLNGYSQWVFDLSLYQQNGLLSIIISGPGKHQQLPRKDLIEKVAKELNSLFKLPKLDWAVVIKENKATINCSVKNNQFRPTNKTAIKGLYLAGDYTDTSYSSTIEGAVLSGRKAAQLGMIS